MRHSMIILAAGLLFAFASQAAGAVVRNLDAPGALSLLKQRPNVYLLDVRTPEEYRQGHLAGAHLIPIDQIAQRLGELPANQPILVYCAVGSRSAQVFNFLARRGYPEVYNLDGGIYAWAQNGYPIQQNP